MAAPAPNVAAPAAAVLPVVVSGEVLHAGSSIAESRDDEEENNFGLAISAPLFNWSTTIECSPSDSVAQVRYIVLEKLYREKAAIFDFDPYHGLFILATEAEEILPEFATIYEVVTSGDLLILAPNNDIELTGSEVMCAHLILVMTNLVLGPLALLSRHSEIDFKDTDNLFTFPLRKLREEGIGYFYLGLATHTATSEMANVLLEWNIFPVTDLGNMVGTVVVSALSLTLTRIRVPASVRKLWGRYTIFDAIFAFPSLQDLSRRLLSSQYWCAVAMGAFICGYTSDTLAKFGCLFTSMLGRFLAVEEPRDFTIQMTQMLDPHSLCFNSIISARFWHFVHDQLNVRLASYCRSVSTRKMNKYVAAYGRDGAQKPLRRMLLACGAVGLSVCSLFVLLLSSGSPPKRQ